MPAPEKIMNVRELFLRIARLPLAEKGRVLLFPLEKSDYAYAVRNERFPAVDGRRLMLDYANPDEESVANCISPRQFRNVLRDAIDEGYADAIVAAETLFPSASVNVVTGVDIDADTITLETRKETL